jgi:hypothetical protein
MDKSSITFSPLFITLIESIASLFFARTKYMLFLVEKKERLFQMNKHFFKKLLITIFPRLSYLNYESNVFFILFSIALDIVTLIAICDLIFKNNREIVGGYNSNFINTIRIIMLF